MIETIYQDQNEEHFGIDSDLYQDVIAQLMNFVVLDQQQYNLIYSQDIFSPIDKLDSYKKIQIISYFINLNENKIDDKIKEYCDDQDLSEYFSYNKSQIENLKKLLSTIQKQLKFKESLFYSSQFIDENTQTRQDLFRNSLSDDENTQPHLSDNLSNDENTPRVMQVSQENNKFFWFNSDNKIIIFLKKIKESLTKCFKGFFGIKDKISYNNFSKINPDERFEADLTYENIHPTNETSVSNQEIIEPEIDYNSHEDDEIPEELEDRDINDKLVKQRISFFENLAQNLAQTKLNSQDPNPDINLQENEISLQANTISSLESKLTSEIGSEITKNPDANSSLESKSTREEIAPKIPQNPDANIKLRERRLLKIKTPLEACNMD